MSWHSATALLATCVLLGASGCAAPAVPKPTPPNDLAQAVQSLANADNALVSIAPAAECCPKQNLPQFLGFECIYKGVACLFDGIRNRLGMAFPGLEAKPRLLAITDPANMSEDAPPAVQAAAEIKSEEDQAAQKIKAIRYLATIGCGGCYPDVEDALIAAMEDCTEEVRYEAVLAVRKTTCIKCCYCSCDACCTEKIQNKLRDLANGQPCPCCVGEQSARIRRQARLALAACGPPVVFEEPEPEEPEPAPGPTEGPTEGPDGEESGPASEDPEGKKDSKKTDDDKEGEAAEEVVEATDRAAGERSALRLQPTDSASAPGAGSSNRHRLFKPILEALPPVIPS